MKKLLSILSLVVVLASPSFSQDDMVKLIRSENYPTCGFGGTFLKKHILIQVRNIAYDKQVYVHHQLMDSSWVDIPASYIRQCNSTYELWGLDSTEVFGQSSFGNQFVVKYIVLGQTYWDNNNGANYTLLTPVSHMEGPGPMLGNYINVLLRDVSSFDGYPAAYIDIRNIAYVKDVRFIYTNNNWATYVTLNAVYQSYTRTDFGSYIYWPNGYGVERWKVDLSNITLPIQFYISYTVNGQTYYDNNYCSNYFLSN